MKARRNSKISLTRQIAEISLLRLGKGKLSAKEYFDFRLHDSTQYTWEQKKAFFGKRMENRLAKLVKSSRYGVIAHDKALFYLFMDRIGLPVPGIYGIAEQRRRLPNIRSLNSESELSHFLTEEVEPPFVAKPIWGIYSRDVFIVTEVDSSRNLLVCSNGERHNIDEFCSRAVGKDLRKYFLNRSGFLFQPMLSPHPDIGVKCGNKLSTIRVMIQVNGAKPIIYNTLWKIPSGNNMADNYWRPGNAMGLINQESGIAEKIITGRGFDLRNIDKHPDTNELLLGYKLPYWDEVIELGKKAAMTLPELPLQAWDIALCQNGPLLLEVNIVGGLDLPQLANSQGVYDKSMQNLLLNYGF